MAGIDLKSLKEEIDKKKSSLDNRKAKLGEMIPQKQTGDQFLRELMHSAHTGVETNASIKVKSVDRLSEAKQIAKKTGRSVDPNLLNQIASRTPSTNTPVPNYGNQPQKHTQGSPSAAEVARMEEAKRIREQYNNPNNPNPNPPNNGLADSMAQYMNLPKVGAPMNNNGGYLNEQQMLASYGTLAAQAPNSLLSEQLNKVAKEMLNENFGKLYAEAMKNSIIEAYRAEVLKNALKENREFIEEIVRDTIIELQNINNSKKR